MTEKQTKTTTSPSINPYQSFKKQLGNTTYTVGMHFSETSKETLEGKLQRLILNELKSEISLYASLSS
ncbi:MAG: transposon-encoded TnpW family protein [Clostridia bacterium]